MSNKIMNQIWLDCIVKRQWMTNKLPTAKYLLRQALKKLPLWDHTRNWLNQKTRLCIQILRKIVDSRNPTRKFKVLFQFRHMLQKNRVHYIFVKRRHFRQQSPPTVMLFFSIIHFLNFSSHFVLFTHLPYFYSSHSIF